MQVGLGCSSKTFRHEASIGPLRAQTSKSPPSNPSGLHLGCRVGMVFLCFSVDFTSLEFWTRRFFGVSRHNFRKKSGSRGLWSCSDCGLQLFRYDFFAQFMQLGGRVSFFSKECMPHDGCLHVSYWMKRAWRSHKWHSADNIVFRGVCCSRFSCSYAGEIWSKGESLAWSLWMPWVTLQE